MAGDDEPDRDATDTTAVNVTQWAEGSVVRRMMTGKLGISVPTESASSMTESSVAALAGRRLSAATTRYYRASVVHALSELLWRAARRSWLYGWLTAEPDPSLITIDLEDTVFGSVLLWFTCRFNRSLRTSLLGVVTDRVAGEMESGPVRAVSILLVAALVTNIVAIGFTGSLTDGITLAKGLLLGIALLGLRVDTPWEELKSSRVVQLVAAVLEPPETDE